MAGRTIRSSGHQASSEESSQQLVETERSERQHTRRVISSEQTSRASKPGEFVDARELAAGSTVGGQIDDATFGSSGFRSRRKVIEFPQRERERLRARRKTIAVRTLSIIAAIAVITGVVWGLFFSPLLVLEESEIQVGGTNTWVSSERVERLVVQQAGKSLLLVHAGALEEEIRSLPGVTQAEVTKEYPHGLSVQVQAQVPAAILRSNDDTMVAVDSMGRVLNDVHASVEGIPVIGVSNVDTALKQASVSQAVSILGSLDEATRQRISSVEAKTRDSITTKLDNDALTIIWGDASDLKLKRAIVATFLAQPDKLAGATTIDVSAPERPIIK